MIIELDKAKEKIRHKKIEEKIEFYASVLSEAFDNVNHIVDDMEESGINWHHASEEQKEKLESISLISLWMESYVWWAKE